MLYNHLSSIFDATVALDHAKIELVPGQIHSIVGENGAGKSTLLKVIAAVHKPDSGKITIDGQHLIEIGRASCRERV